MAAVVGLKEAAQSRAFGERMSGLSDIVPDQAFNPGGSIPVPIEIVFEGIEPSKAIRTKIEREAEKLEPFHD